MSEGNKLANGGSNAAPVKAVNAGAPSNMYHQINAVMNHQAQTHPQSNGVYLNPHAAAQAAAAFTAAAQQLVQAQMQQPLSANVVAQQANNVFNSQGKPNGQQNPFAIARSNSTPVTAPSNMQLGAQVQQNAPMQVSVDGSNVSSTNAFSQASLSQGQNPNVTSNNTQAPTPANVFLNQQQLALSAQAQAAAILAAGSLNPSLMLNAHSHAHAPAPSNPAAMAAAQVVASLLQSQTQSVTPHTLQSTRLNETPTQAHVKELKAATPVQTTTASTLHHTANNAQAIANLKSPMAENRTNFSSFNVSMPESSRPLKRNSTEAPAPATQSASANQSLYVAAAAAANNPVLLTQMRNWKLDQLGKFQFIPLLSSLRAFITKDI